MRYFIVKVDPRTSQAQNIAGPFGTVTLLIDALDNLLTQYSNKEKSRRYVWWIEEHEAEHKLIIEELPEGYA